jgi:hypothetical protein
MRNLVGTESKETLFMSNESDSLSGQSSADRLREAQALQEVLQAVSALQIPAIRRILDWVADTYGLAAVTNRSVVEEPASREQRNQVGKPAAMTPREGRSSKFANFAALYDAANPNTDASRALVAGYWFQVAEGGESFASQAVNMELKDLGHGVTNITAAFTDLAQHNPVWARQVKKAGTSQQARKLYRLTAAGIREVERMTTESLSTL